MANASLICIVAGMACFGLAAWMHQSPFFNRLLALGLFFGLASRIAW